VQSERGPISLDSLLAAGVARIGLADSAGFTITHHTATIACLDIDVVTPDFWKNYLTSASTSDYQRSAVAHKVCSQ